MHRLLMASFHKRAISWHLILVTDVFVASKLALNLLEFSFFTSNFYLTIVSTLHYLFSIGSRNWRENSFPFLIRIILHSILHTIRYHFFCNFISLFSWINHQFLKMSVIELYFHLFLLENLVELMNFLELADSWVSSLLADYLFIISNNC